MTSIAQRTKPPAIPETVGACPGCHVEIAPRLQMALESIRGAATRPAMLPDILILCRRCQRQFVVELRPAPERGA